jgi:hypothetical protein
MIVFTGIKKIANKKVIIDMCQKWRKLIKYRLKSVVFIAGYLFGG